jgi:hypothetical protein
MGPFGEAILEAHPAFLADPIRKPGVMPGDRVGEQSPEPTTAEPMHRPQSASAGVIDPLSRASDDPFEVSFRIDGADHRLKFRSVFAEIVPKGSKGGSFRCPPCLGELPS